VFSSSLPEGTLHRGDIIASAPAENAPYGFLYRVKTVSASGGKTKVTTEPATIEEAVKDANVNLTLDLNDYIDEIVLIGDDGKETPVKAATSDAQTKSTVVEGKIDVLKGVGFTSEGGTGINAIIQGPVTYKLTANIELLVQGWDLQVFSVVMGTDIAADLDIGVEGRLKWSKKDPIVLAKFKLKPIFFMAGPVPVIMVPEIPLEVELGFDGSMKLMTHKLKFHYQFQHGIAYTDGKLRPIATTNTVQKPVITEKDTENIILSGEVTVEPRLSFRCKLYNNDNTTVGVYAGFPVKAQVDEIQFTYDDYIYGTAAINPRLQVSYAISLGVAGNLESVSKKLKDFNHSFDLITWPPVIDRKVFPEFFAISLVNGTQTSIDAVSTLKKWDFIYPVQNYGFCWGETARPTVDGAKVAFGPLTPGIADVPMLHSIENLNKEKTYYIRAWFQNYFGVLYAQAIPFNLNAPFITLIPEAIDFGEVETGYDRYESLMIENTGNAPLVISSISSSDPAFTVNWSQGTIAAGESRSIFVIFAPTQQRTYSGTLTIKSNVADKTVALSGRGAREDDGTGISVYPRSLSSQMSVTSFTIANNSDAPVTVTSITAPAGCSLNWTQGVIAAGASRTVNVTFSNNKITGTITINSNAPNGTQYITVTDLPDGVLINGVVWATRNLDFPGTFAARPESFGRLYQWNKRASWSVNGDVNWSCDPRNIDVSIKTWAKANDPSPAGWRIPTLEEANSLWDAQKVSWDSNAVENGVKGRRFTDKSNGNSIFFPRAGIRVAGLYEYWAGGVIDDPYISRTCRTGDFIPDYLDYWASTAPPTTGCVFYSAYDFDYYYRSTQWYPFLCQTAHTLFGANGLERICGLPVRCVLE